MTWLKSLCLNFFFVFFANYLLPGIEIVHPTKLPHIGGDLFFAVALGLLNSLIYPVLKATQRPLNAGSIALGAIGLSFIAYGILKFAPVGVEIKTLEGYLLTSILVAIGAFATNYLEMRNSKPPSAKPPESTGTL